MGPNALTPHKHRLLLVWRSHRLLFGRRRRAAAPTGPILGDVAGIVKYLRGQLNESQLTLYRLEWLERGGAWWDEHIEAPVDVELLELMRKRVPRKSSESDAAYERRCWAVVSSLRGRLGDVRPGSRRHLGKGG